MVEKESLKIIDEAKLRRRQEEIMAGPHEWEKSFPWVMVLLSLGKERKEGATFVFSIIQ